MKHIKRNVVTPKTVPGDITMALDACPRRLKGGAVTKAAVAIDGAESKGKANDNEVSAATQLRWASDAARR